MFCEADAFLNELHKLFERAKGHGSVWLTMKRTNLKPRRGKAAGTGEYKCLLRASDGKRKISTALLPAEYAKFQTSYALILRAHMDALKKREKVKAAGGAAGAAGGTTSSSAKKAGGSKAGGAGSKAK